MGEPFGDWSYLPQYFQEAASHMTGAALDIGREWSRPSVLFRPRLYLDGDQYCALYGENIMSGCAGFGDTPDAAMLDFDKNWSNKKP